MRARCRAGADLARRRGDAETRVASSAHRRRVSVNAASTWWTDEPRLPPVHACGGRAIGHKYQLLERSWVGRHGPAVGAGLVRSLATFSEGDTRSSTTTRAWACELSRHSGRCCRDKAKYTFLCERSERPRHRPGVSVRGSFLRKRTRSHKLARGSRRRCLDQYSLNNWLQEQAGPAFGARSLEIQLLGRITRGARSRAKRRNSIRCRSEGWRHAASV